MKSPALLFSRSRALTPRLARALADAVGSFERAFDLGEARIESWLRRFGRRGFEGFAELDRKADALLDVCARRAVTPISLGEATYPARLSELSDSPLVLFVRGEVSALAAAKLVAVVGSREPDERHRAFARECGRHLASRGVPVVSGLAFGVDAASHEGACSGPGAPPVAVLAGGCDLPTPRGNESLYRRILEKGGAVVGEKDPGTHPEKWGFPERNRLISGLSDSVLVVAAGRTSGALHTVRSALEQGREVRVARLDGSALPEGNRACLADGAIPVRSVDDVLVASDGLRLGDAEPVAFRSEDPLLRALASSPRATGALARELGQNAEAVAARLMRLLLDGRVSPLPGDRWQLLA